MDLMWIKRQSTFLSTEVKDLLETTGKFKAVQSQWMIDGFRINWKVVEEALAGISTYHYLKFSYRK